MLVSADQPQSCRSRLAIQGRHDSVALRSFNLGV
jgi:hypothetical protein